MSNRSFCIFKHSVNPYAKSHKISSDIESMYEIFKYKAHYVVIAGDIYNIESIKHELSIQSDSIEEIVLELYFRVGLDIPNYLRGIFTVVIMNSEKIVLFRDFFSLGSIYFYFADSKNEFVITNRITELGKFRNLNVNTKVLPRYFATSNINTGDTFFDGISSLKCFELLQFSISENRLTSTSYDDSFFKIIANDKLKDNFIIHKSEDIILKNLKEILNYYSGSHVINALSGGVDSSYLQILLEKLGHRKAATHSHETIGTIVQEYSRDISDYLDIEHDIIKLKTGDILKNLKEGILICENPYIYEGEFLQNHLYDYISKRQKNNVLISSGSGADTIFGFGRSFFELTKFSNPIFLQAFNLVNECLLRYFNKKAYQRYKRIIGKLKSKTVDEEFLYILFNINTHEDMIKSAFHLDNLYQIYSKDIQIIDRFEVDLVERLQRWKILEYELCRENQVSYELSWKYGLNICFPFLGKELVYYLSSIPMKKRIRRLTPKYYMKKMLLRHLPSKFVYRKDIPQGTKNFLYHLDNEKMSGLIEKIKSTQYSYFKFDYERIFSDEIYYSLAIKLINFYIWHKIFIEGTHIDEI